jgi:hypothetical protein
MRKVVSNALPQASEGRSDYGAVGVLVTRLAERCRYDADYVRSRVVRTCVKQFIWVDAGHLVTEWTPVT